MEQDQEFLEYVVKAIVNHPEDVKSTRTVDERGVLITLDLNPSDMGYVIGRRGQTARAVRTLLKVVGAKNNARVNLKINEPEGSRGPRPRTDDDHSHYGSAPSTAPAAAPTDDDIDMSAVENFNI
ncbi:MAG: RNA-binding protein [Candidatus Magasanikbacteria bacterium CG10_big_fil_rev_8_21_14_0_10_43_6]|uniref:RNA-binding protein KhpA n=1 Tax=Candidatus Magasanikbacteria bacterium CG10_big_fil_rev_8_21_14_0_10_43_6 TaxID=1974650 RepID=A0A2M6W1M5_9BACT|nr:MAG: RNA-binding protein [Candidatus Magasanikbacteria bacterium CG10_big_fil_rev_8_21_14_0_10_43_6]